MNEDTKPKALCSTPLVLLCILLFVVQVANGLYFARGIEPSSFFDIIYAVGFLWLVGWWLKQDSRKYGVKWVYDMGFFLYLGWVFIIPYYLFKTRGVRAFVTILSFVLIFLGTYLVGVVVSMLSAT